MPLIDVDEFCLNVFYKFPVICLRKLSFAGNVRHHFVIVIVSNLQQSVVVNSDFRALASTVFPPLVSKETIFSQQKIVRKLIEGRNYLRAETNGGNTV